MYIHIFNKLCLRIIPQSLFFFWGLMIYEVEALDMGHPMSFLLLTLQLSLNFFPKKKIRPRDEVFGSWGTYFLHRGLIPPSLRAEVLAQVIFYLKKKWTHSSLYESRGPGAGTSSVK